MGLKKCGKCGELADEAKAFCPECGNSFENEPVRKENSEFELSSGTMQITGSAFELMLSDMGLNVSGMLDDENPSSEPAPDPQEKAGAAKGRSVLSSAPLLIGIAVMFLIVVVIIAFVYVAYFR